MSVITKKFLKKERIVLPIRIKSAKQLWESYMDYAKRQRNLLFLWYMKVIMVFPCVIMVPMIFLMAMATPNYVWFVALTILLFYANVVTHIVGAKSTLYVPLYHASMLIMILIPIITYLSNL